MTLHRWPRPFHEPSGRAAELLYLVVGAEPPQPLPVSRRRHHVERIDPALSVSTHRRSDDPAWFDAWLTGPLGRELDGLFLRPEEVRAAQVLTAVRASLPDPGDLEYLRSAVGLVSALLDAPGARAVFDAVALTWWRANDWRAAFVDEPPRFDVRDHVGIAVRDDPAQRPGLWAHTRGMAKFARPELLVRRVPGEYSSRNVAIDAAEEVLAALAQPMCLGAMPPAGQAKFWPGTDVRYVLVAAPDDSAGARYFNNAALEICDADPTTRQPLPGAAKLLEAVAAQCRGEDPD